MSSANEMIVTFPGGKRVDTEIGGHVIRTDQPASGGGENTAPAPFSLFLASIGTCAGIYVVGFCQKRDLPTAGIRIVQRNHFDPQTGALAGVDLDIEVPPSFPDKYHEALVRVADQCAVKKAIQLQPRFEVRTVVR
ncbi:MAG TPA: OsmC family protein [Anaeromyxobacteraceae bacterium]|nr:OsmC family protein [Anaeromyxobacteraceae bacterium]